MLFRSELISDPAFPKPYPLRSFAVRTPFRRLTQPYFLVMPSDNPEIQGISSFMPGIDLFLGQDFFMNRSWTFDYARQEIWVNTPLTKSEPAGDHTQTLGFKKNSRGDKLFGHPSMTIEVDGETIPVLFDTGATICLSEEGKLLLGTDQMTIGGSFIANSIMKRWRERHPDWKYYPGADVYSETGDLIEVPSLKIGGHDVGPALFAAARPVMEKSPAPMIAPIPSDVRLKAPRVLLRLCSVSWASSVMADRGFFAKCLFGIRGEVCVQRNV